MVKGNRLKIIVILGACGVDIYTAMVADTANKDRRRRAVHSCAGSQYFETPRNCLRRQEGAGTSITTDLAGQVRKKKTKKNHKKRTW